MNLGYDILDPCRVKVCAKKGKEEGEEGRLRFHPHPEGWGLPAPPPSPPQVKNLPLRFTEQYPEIPWRFIAGMRDKLIHHYFGVSLEIVWETVQSDMPVLREWLKGLKEEL